MLKRIKKLLAQRKTRRAIKKLPKLHRDTERLRKKYPNYLIGTGTYGDLSVSDWHEGSTLKIGAYTSIARNVHILLGGHHRLDWVTVYPFPAKIEEAASIPDYGGTHGDVIIGSDVWLCTDATILSGITIGHGAVVASSALVTKDVPPYAIVGGNPARFIKWRFDEDVRHALLESAWWDWPEHEIRAISHLLCSDNLDAFLVYAKQRSAS